MPGIILAEFCNFIHFFLNFFEISISPAESPAQRLRPSPEEIATNRHVIRPREDEKRPPDPDSHTSAIPAEQSRKPVLRRSACRPLQIPPRPVSYIPRSPH